VISVKLVVEVELLFENLRPILIVIILIMFIVTPDRPIPKLIAAI